MADYINREVTLKILTRIADCVSDSRRRAVTRCIREIASLAPANVEPVRNGRWEECDWVDVDEHGFGTRRTFKAGLRCNQCACVFKKELLWKRNYCPSCGRKMDLDGENNDD